jgi:benzoyl-CoA reductase/2-hydroxyglutaryl-CoA dehydratase subunit BcrC/BadD/HgdB
MTQKEIENLRNTIKTASLKVISENIARMKKTSPNRPEIMQYFDEMANLFGQREKEIKELQDQGKKVIGYLCMFAPVELILAADAIPVRVGSGWYDPAKQGDKIVPVEVCPIVRSTIGTKMIGLSPFLEMSDVIINPPTCDGMTKLGEILSDQKSIWTLSAPRIKDDPQSLIFWKEEIKAMKKKIEGLTGVKITAKRLRAAIELRQKASLAFRRLQDVRKISPVIMGRDAMLVSQTITWDDTQRWTEKTMMLCDELERRVKQEEWACSPSNPRVMITGTPMFWPDNWKIPHLVEEAKPQGLIAADELCSGDRILYDPVGVDEWTGSDMLSAVAEKYLMASTCPCFTSADGNEDRINWLLDRIKEFKIDGVIYYTVRGCMLYAMEYARVKRILDKMNVPIYYLDTEYTREDVGQIKTRIEAFMEMLDTRVQLSRGTQP